MNHGYERVWEAWEERIFTTNAAAGVTFLQAACFAISNYESKGSSRAADCHSFNHTAQWSETQSKASQCTAVQPA